MNPDAETAWPPHVTVAVVVEQDGRYLMVEEQDELAGGLVFNQPAGHLDPGEGLLEAALRETLEETGWEVELTEVDNFEDLPANARDYVRRIEEYIGVPITAVGVGPKRSQTIFRQ